MPNKPIRLFIFLLFLIFSLIGNSAFSGDIVINEIYADPHNTLGDANGDGTRNATQDEFIELVNASGSPVNISGWTLSDALNVRHIFPAGTILNGHAAIVVFGGGTPTGSFGGALVQTASTGQLSLNNSGDTVTLSDGVMTQAEEIYGSAGGDDQSLTRDPDVTGSFVKHSTATGSGGALFSPGTKIDGSLFSAPATVVTFADANLEQSVRAALGKPTGDIYDTDLATLTVLNARGQTISDLAGLEHATNLSELDLGDNLIQQLASLENLTSLTKLWLDSNQLDNADLPSLNDLDNLIYLNLSNNPAITNGTAVAALAGELENLECEDIIWDGVCGADPILALGDLVWLDANIDGQFNTGDTGIADITVELYQDSDKSGDWSAGDSPVETTVTDENGNYNFTELLPGSYIVRIAPTNFAAGQPLEVFESTPGSNDPNNDTDADDNGLDTSDPATSGIVSQAIVLEMGGEPNENGNSNFTLDFGFFKPAFADLQITGFTSSKTNPALGENITLTLTALNAGPDAAQNALAQINFPAGLNYVSANPASFNSGTGKWTIGNLEKDQAATLELVMLVNATGTLQTTAFATNDVTDPNPANNADSVSVFAAMPRPIADFRADTTWGIGSLTVQFENLSENATDWEWNFGDGTTSSEMNPTHEFTWNDCAPVQKSFNVSLKAISDAGEDLAEKADYITIYSPARAAVSAEVTEFCSGSEVTLLNSTCGAVSVWTLNWGDGTVETGTFPVTHWQHTYTTELPGESFTVTLAVEGKGGADIAVAEDLFTIHGPIVADFAANETYGVAPMEVQFSDLSQGWVTSWLWDFGDGTTSEDQNPIHIYYVSPKHVTVTLTVCGPCDQQTVTKADYLTVNRAVKVLFEAAPIVGAPGLEVQLTNNVGGSATHFSLNYGDGTVENFKQSFSTRVHPYHIYHQPGEFTISLAAWGNGGADTLTIPGLVYIDDEFEYRKLALVSSGKTYPGLGWENAVDHDVFGAGATVAAEANDAWAVFVFRDSSAHQIQKIRLLTDSIDPEQMITNHLSEFEIWISNDGQDFGTAAAFTGRSTAKEGAWEIFLLEAPVSAKFLKIQLTAARGAHAKYREFAEIQVFSPIQSLSLAKETPDVAENMEAPASFILEQNYPNPFNPETKIRFQLPEAAQVNLSIYNIQGQLIRSLAEGNFAAGHYNFVWNAQNSLGEFVANGIYIYQLTAKGTSQQTVLTKRMILMK